MNKKRREEKKKLEFQMERVISYDEIILEKKKEKKSDWKGEELDRIKEKDMKKSRRGKINFVKEKKKFNKKKKKIPLKT